MASLKQKQIDVPRDEHGNAVLTEDYIKDLCVLNGQYETPRLNDTLYLHYKGFKKIECLEKYTHLKSIWLECNGLLKIEGLENQLQLRMIMFQQNTIRKIENISHLKKLVRINLSHNLISVIEGLKGLDELQTIDLSHNMIQNTASCEELLWLPSIKSIDLKQNKIDDSENVLPFFTQFRTISALYLQGNPCIRNVSNYRKKLIESIPSLN